MRTNLLVKRLFGLRAYDNFSGRWEHSADRNGRLPRHEYIGDAVEAERCRAGIDGEGLCGLLADYAVHDQRASVHRERS